MGRARAVIYAQHALAVPGVRLRVGEHPAVVVDDSGVLRDARRTPGPASALRGVGSPGPAPDEQ